MSQKLLLAATLALLFPVGGGFAQTRPEPAAVAEPAVAAAKAPAGQALNTCGPVSVTAIAAGGKDLDAAVPGVVPGAGPTGEAASSPAPTGAAKHDAADTGSQ